jgi:hypothetical protein
LASLIHDNALYVVYVSKIVVMCMNSRRRILQQLFECDEPCDEISPCVDPWLAVVMKIFDHALLFLKGPCMLRSVRGKACKARLKAWKAR